MSDDGVTRRVAVEASGDARRVNIVILSQAH